MSHTTEELNRLSLEEKEKLQTDALKQFGLPPLAILHIWVREAAIFTLIGGLFLALAGLSLSGLVYGSVFGLGFWIAYRLLRFLLA
jgi:ABC-type antimicrobial peptide transport system permease subunit